MQAASAAAPLLAAATSVQRYDWSRKETVTGTQSATPAALEEATATGAKESVTFGHGLGEKQATVVRMEVLCAFLFF